MAYFVTGATGFIGRFLMAQLLQREGTIYVLCRASSLDKLDELRERLGTDEQRVVAVVGELGKERLGVSNEDVEAVLVGVHEAVEVLEQRLDLPGALAGDLAQGLGERP